MRFQTIQIINYKSFCDSGEIKLDAGFNIIVGKNDAGKTALIEALSLQAKSKPHRSFHKLARKGITPEPNSITKASIKITREEVDEILRSENKLSYFAYSVLNEEHAAKRTPEAIEKPNNFLIELMNGEVQLRESGLNESQVPLHSPAILKQGLINNKDCPHNFSPNYELLLDFLDRPAEGTLNYVQVIYNYFKNLIYAFRAERLNIGECSIGNSHTLRSDASNLPEVLHNLITSNRSRFNRFLDHVITVFPHITDISVPHDGNGSVKIYIWSHPTDTERDDLAIPLSESGTGIGQVLAMLYVVVMADDPKVIIIDEPQSFLHPGAVRKLFEILQSYDQHQYIITTHSPIAITATDAQSLLLIKREKYESKVQKISHQNREELEAFLNEVGARLSDVFGADRVLWVEGKTEEECFPLIIKKLLKIPLAGKQILGVNSPPDLRDKHKYANKIFEIYNRLQSAPTLLPPAIAFILDQENLTDKQRQSIDEKSGRRVKWLPRRMFENYLLDPNSIATILNEDDSELGSEVLAEHIQNWIEAHARETKYFDKRKEFPQYPNTAWYEQVDGANLMKDLFGDLTDQRVSYDKVKHGCRLTEKLIENPTPDFQELADFLKPFFNQ